MAIIVDTARACPTRILFFPFSLLINFNVVRNTISEAIAEPIELYGVPKHIPDKGISIKNKYS